MMGKDGGEGREGDWFETEGGFGPQRLLQRVVADIIAKSRRNEHVADDAIVHLAA